MANNNAVSPAHRHIRRGADVISVNIIGYVLIGLFALLCLTPFYLIIVASFTDNSELIRSGYPVHGIPDQNKTN